MSYYVDQTFFYYFQEEKRMEERAPSSSYPAEALIKYQIYTNFNQILSKECV